MADILFYSGGLYNPPLPACPPTPWVFWVPVVGYNGLGGLGSNPMTSWKLKFSFGGDWGVDG